MTNTYDHKKLISPYGLEDIDRAFLEWWDKKLDLHLDDKDGNKKKVPVAFFTAERWHKARNVGIRDDNGTLICPIIGVSRTSTTDSTDGPLGRRFQDLQQYHTIAKEVDTKTSLVKNLLDSRAHNIDPNLPIYEMFSIPTPDHFALTYEVAIWVPYMEDINETIEKIGHEFNYKSKKCFSFGGDTMPYFVAFKEEEINDEGNLNDFSNNERIIKKEYVFGVSAHIIPQSDERKDAMRRYWSQSRIVIKSETPLTQEEVLKYFKK